MSPEPADDDEQLKRWAARYAPAVLARAQAEAVAALRDALVEAALEQTRGSDRPQPPSPPPDREDRESERESEPSARGDLLWAYCVLRSSDAHPAELTGVDPGAPIERVRSGNLAVLVSRVRKAEFGAEPLRRNLNDLPWLERVARAHEAVLDATLADSTIVPLRLCTLYENEDSVQQMLEQERGSFDQALTGLDGKLEWALKALVDWTTMTTAVQTEDDAPGPAETSSDDRGEGSAYLLQRRSERAVRNAAASIAAGVADEIHACLQDWAIDAITRPAQNRELAGYSGEMILNAAYLVERVRTDELQQLVSELEERHRHLGVTLELTGPWPPYNFVPGGALS